MSFRIHVTVRIFLAIGFGIAAFYFAVNTPFWLLAGWMGLFFILVVISLIRYVEKSDRELSNFLMAIRQNDFTNTYPQTKRNTKKLYQAFNVITSEFLRIRSEKESNYHFLKTVVEHSGVPLVAYSVADEKITLVNKAAKVLFGLPHFTKLQSLNRVNDVLVEKVKQLHSNDKVLLKLELNGEVMYLSVVVRELVLHEKSNKVIAFHNINSELDQKELESWQKLIRVLTHEIKNSVIPIATLSEVINDMLRGNRELRDITAEDADDLILSIQTIEKRSKGLVKFVTNYGDMAKIPKPEPEEVNLNEMIQSVAQLESKTIEQAGVTLVLNLPVSGIMVTVDREMIEQVLINLMKNAIEAMLEAKTQEAKLTVGIKKDQNDVLVLVKDNGPGMDQETIENIFVPFFTTKKEGSGIGLSYSKQVMRAHKGNIRVRSEIGQGSTFELRF